MLKNIFTLFKQELTEWLGRKKMKTFALLFLASEDTRPLALSFQSQQGDQTGSLERVATYKRRKAIEALSPNLGVHALGAVM